MKNKFHFHFYLRLFFLILLGVALSFFAVKANIGGGGLDQEDFEFRGWAWSPNIGWLSLNCLNDFNGDGDLGDLEDNTCISGGGVTDYGLYLDASSDENVRAVGGCAWAGNVGWWVCFDDPGLLGNTEAPDFGVYLNGPTGVKYYNGSLPAGLSPVNTSVENSLCHDDDVLCHASILPLEGETEWTNELGFPIGGTSSGVIESCFNCSEVKQCDDGFQTSCNTDTDCGEGFICEVIRSCDNCLEYNYDIDGYLTSVIGGYECVDCVFNGPEGIDTRCTENAYQNNQNSCTSCDTYYTTPGMIVDYPPTISDDGYMCGWAWNQHSGSGNGVGWIQFSPRITALNNPYFQVDSGNIYSKGNINATFPPPPNIYNAYIIEAGGAISNVFASSSPAGLSTLENRLINFPARNATTGKYENALGKIDYDGLITEVGTSGKNKYNTSIDDDLGGGAWDDIINGGNLNLAGKIYTTTAGTAIATNPLTIMNGSGNTDSSGVIVIDGNANIVKNIAYDSTSPDRLKNIASPVWIINGDLSLASDVAEISGTFIVFGEFNVGGGSNQLVINGSVLAESFVLDRNFGGAAEKFVNDGRLQVNPPAGLQGFASSLPRFNYSPY